MSAQCTDRVVGDILSSWRYDISGLAPEMRVDYEAHLAECTRCHTRQRIHRAVDICPVIVGPHMSANDRYVVLGLAHVRSPWFREVSRWATSAVIPIDFVKCVSVDTP